jgi:hypothetical protein
MEIPSNVRVYFDAIAGEARRGRLLAVSDAGYYEVSLQLAGGSFRALLPIERTFILSDEPEEQVSESIEIER